MALCATCAAGQISAEGFTDRFSTLNSSRWAIAHYDFSHPSFATDWRRNQVSVDAGLTFTLSASEDQNRFRGGSIRSHDTYKFGFFEARLKAGKGPGVVTGFFTYSGPYYGTPHDEIDVEILGRDPTKLHIAWFVDGALTNHYIPLGFDASKCIHDFGFLWEPDALSWFVNGTQVFRHTIKDGPIPTHAGHVFANLWAADPSISSWSGTIEPGANAEAHFERIEVAPLVTSRSNS